MRKFALALAACAAATIALAGDERRTYIVATDREWLWSDKCTAGTTDFVVPEHGVHITKDDQCALELMLKRQLRKGPIDAGPAPNPRT